MGLEHGSRMTQVAPLRRYLATGDTSDCRSRGGTGAAARPAVHRTVPATKGPGPEPQRGRGSEKVGSTRCSKGPWVTGACVCHAIPAPPPCTHVCADLAPPPLSLRSWNFSGAGLLRTVCLPSAWREGEEGDERGLGLEVAMKPSAGIIFARWAASSFTVLLSPASTLAYQAR